MTQDNIQPPPVVPCQPRSNLRWWALGFGLLLLLLALIYIGGRLFSSAAQLSGALPAREGTIVASFRADFRPKQPKDGWRYCWNREGPVNDPNTYEDLVWNGQLYATINKALPGPPPGRYLRLANGSGHPGQGPSQTSGSADEHAVVIGFTVPEAGRYVLVRSTISRHAGARSGGVHLQVFGKESSIGGEVFCRSNEGMPFDRELGRLSKGDTIYVSIGPDETDQDDSFDLDFSIGRL